LWRRDTGAAFYLESFLILDIEQRFAPTTLSSASHQPQAWTQFDFFIILIYFKLWLLFDFGNLFVNFEPKLV
jgi:hypothetical protein